MLKLCCEGVRDATGVVGGCGAVDVAAGTTLTVGCVACGPRILELIGPLSFNVISNASDLPPLAVGVLCVVREPDAAGSVAGPPGVVAALLISYPVCEPSRRAVVMGAAPALPVTNVGVGRTETTCGPWSAAVSADVCFAFFADFAESSTVRLRFSPSAFRSASRSCRISNSSATLRGGGGGICVDCATGGGANGGRWSVENGLDCENAAIDCWLTSASRRILVVDRAFSSHHASASASV